MPKFNVHRVRFFDYIPQAIHCLSYDERTNKIALSRADNSIEIWSLGHNWFQEKVIHPCTSSVEGLIWAQGRLFSAGLGCDVTEYDLISLQPKQTTPSYSGAVWSLTCNQQHTQLAAGTEDGCITIFDIQDGGLTFVRTFDKQDGRILCLSWHPDGDVIVSGGVDNIRIWSCNSGRARQRLTLQRHERQKEVIVWCLAVTRDFTIISGDSCGRTIFWNGKQGTQIKAVQSHKADVFTLCVSKDGLTVYSSGVDPTIVQLVLVPVSENSDYRHWVRAVCNSRHTHDVRALTLTTEHVVSGGVDCNLCYMAVTPQKGSAGVKRFRPIQHTSLVHVSGSLVLFQFPAHLELWKLGSTKSTSDTAGSLLPLSSKPVKLALLKAKDDGVVVCSALSDDGRWLAYSDHHSIRLFQLDVDLDDLFEPKVTLHRVRYRPANLIASQHLLFTAVATTRGDGDDGDDGGDGGDGGDGDRLLVSAAVDGSVQVVHVDAVQPSLVHQFPPIREPPEPVHLMATSADGRTLVTADLHDDLHLYSLVDRSHLGSLPRLGARATALDVSADGARLLVAYNDRKVLEFDLASRQLSSWCRRTLDKWPRAWLSRPSKTIRRVQYNPANDQQFLVTDVASLAVVDMSLPFSSKENKLFAAGKKTHDAKSAIHVCQYYKLLLHAELLPDDWLLVVERPELSLVQALPESLKQKKFGT